MKMIQMICPSCEAELEMDAGFAGGVCRCSHCATLMIVPRVSGSKAEQLLRRDSPTANGNTRQFSHSGTPSDHSVIQGRLTTASGRVVDVSVLKEIPTAVRRRKGVRAVTIAMFGFIMVVLIGVCITAISLVVNPEPPGPQTVETFTFDRQANPLKIPEPNVLGLPLAQQTVLMLDLTGMSDEIWASLSPLLSDALGRSSRSIRLGLVVYDESGLVTRWGDQPQRLGSHDALKVREMINGLRLRNDPAGVAVLSQCAAVIADMNPERVIVITARAIDEDEVTPFANKIGSAPVDVVVIDEDSDALDRLTRERDGIYRALDSRIDLRRWVEQADAPSSP
jgi:hypothetical protein